MDRTMDLLQSLPFLLRGLGVTLGITGCAAVLAVCLAVPAALAKAGPWRLPRALAVAYIEVFRGTSALVQLFWCYFALPLLGIEIPAVAAGILVLGLNIGAYGAEVVRGAIAAVPRGQHDAATALNLGPVQRMRLIVLPQAALLMLPAWGNLFIELLKGTALVSLITVHELAFQAKLLRDETLRTAEIYLLVLLLYFAAALCITAAMRLLERRLAAGRRAGGAAHV
jgi:polar amino acid transport system permease protein